MKNNPSNKEVAKSQPQWVTELMRILGSIIVALISAYAIVASQATSRVTAEAAEAVPREVDEYLAKLSFPLGTVLPFFGDPELLDETNWLLCDGRDLPPDAGLRLDADPVKGGRQVPDMRGRFLMGLEATEGILNAERRLRMGGSAIIPPDEHQHLWAQYNNMDWFTYDRSGRSFKLTDSTDGMGKDGKGYYTVFQTELRKLETYTDKQRHDHGGINLPPYVKVHYIIKYR